MYSGSFSNLTLGKPGQQAESLRACHHPSVFVDLAVELAFVIHRTLP